jgi:hypothetical protein
MDTHPQIQPSFPPSPRSVGLLLTYRCTAACADCCFECSPRRTESLPLEWALDAVDQLAEVPGVESITISGGECFLRHGDLIRILERARQRGLRTKCVTNGYWALDREAALRKLRPLVEAGLRTLELSTDDYHVEHVPLTRVAHALEAAHALGLETHVIVIADRGTRGLTEILQELDLSFEPEETREFPVLPVGFARQRIPPERLRHREGLPCGLCADALRRPAVGPDGHVYACCGVAGFAPPLRIGEAGEPLQTVFERARLDPLLMVLSMDGPAGLARIAARNNLFDPDQPFVDECHLCHALLSDGGVAEALRRDLDRNLLWYLLRRDWAEAALAGKTENLTNLAGDEGWTSPAGFDGRAPLP